MFCIRDNETHKPGQIGMFRGGPRIGHCILSLRLHNNTSTKSRLLIQAIYCKQDNPRTPAYWLCHMLSLSHQLVKKKTFKKSLVTNSLVSHKSHLVNKPCVESSTWGTLLLLLDCSWDPFA